MSPESVLRLLREISCSVLRFFGRDQLFLSLCYYMIAVILVFHCFITKTLILIRVSEHETTYFSLFYYKRSVILVFAVF